MTSPADRRAALGALGLLLAFLATPAPAASSGKAAEPRPLTEADAQRLFLTYINDPANLIRNCFFLGGVRVDAVEGRGSFATVRIRYRIECTQEEITTPPLTRVLREDFTYRHYGGRWEIVGRAVELPPSMKGEAPVPVTRPDEIDSLDQDRKAIAELVLSWAILGTRPSGVAETYPGSAPLVRASPVLVSNGNLGELGELALPGREVLLLPPEALLRRTALAGGGVWIRFDSLEIEADRATARVSLVEPILPPPRPGERPERVRSRIQAEFSRLDKGWVLTRYRQAEP